MVTSHVHPHTHWEVQCSPHPVQLLMKFTSSKPRCFFSQYSCFCEAWSYRTRGHRPAECDGEAGEDLCTAHSLPLGAEEKHTEAHAPLFKEGSTRCWQVQVCTLTWFLASRASALQREEVDARLWLDSEEKCHKKQMDFVLMILKVFSNLDDSMNGTEMGLESYIENHDIPSASHITRPVAGKKMQHLQHVAWQQHCPISLEAASACVRIKSQLRNARLTTPLVAPPIPSSYNTEPTWCFLLCHKEVENENSFRTAHFWPYLQKL